MPKTSNAMLDAQVPEAAVTAQEGAQAPACRAKIVHAIEAACPRCSGCNCSM